MPLRAAQQVLRTLETGFGRVACFLCPASAAELRVALDRMRADQAVIALCPELRNLKVILHTDDFSSEIDAHRLWLASGASWTQQLNQLFAEQPGLPTAALFIRSPAADKSLTDPLIPDAQKIFADVSQSRTEQATRLASAWTPLGRRTPRLCVLAPSHFRLWDDAGETLWQAMQSIAGQAELVRFDGDDPASASPLALAAQASECDAVVSASLRRADLQQMVNPRQPWIQLIAGDSPRTTSEDEQLIALWPTRQLPRATPGAPIALIADLPGVDVPAAVAEFSSQRLLWEKIEAELRDDPLAIGADPLRYLTDRRQQSQIPDEGFDASLFLQRLIYPAFCRGVARVLLEHDVPARLFGAGWDADLKATSIDTRNDLHAALTGCSGLIDPSPGQPNRELLACGRPVIQATDARRLLHAARQLVRQPDSVSARSSPTAFRGEQILALLARHAR